MKQRFLVCCYMILTPNCSSRTNHASASTSSQSELFFEIWHTELYNIDVFRDLVCHCESVRIDARDR
jgi:hypothetical protein